ncbi:MAG: serine protease [Spirochaetaceae bacterium]|nr:serine protease [Spirochaetaceae bacterium]
MKKIFLFYTIIIAITVISCATKAPVVYEELDYSDEKIIETQIREIISLQKDNPVKALFRSAIIYKNAPDFAGAKELFVNCGTVLTENLQKSIEEKKWYDVYLILQSLKAVEFPLDAGLNALVLEDVHNQYIASLNMQLKDVKNTQSEKIAQFMNGAVTILVDLGIKVENGRGYADKVIGSGFFIDSQGYIVTNYHVISNLVDPSYEGFSRLYIKLYNNTETKIPAKVVGWDKALDLALLKTEITPNYVFSLGSSDNLDIGDKIYAIGSPLGLESTLTSGILSAIDRKLLHVATVMQIDAAINSGNSGGPIVDEKGNVQAVVFAGILEHQGLNFAIPVEYLKMNLPTLYKGGEVRHSWLGGYGKTKKDVGTEKNIGVELLYIKINSSLYLAGFESGDVITALNNRSVSSVEELQTVLLLENPHQIVKVAVLKKDGSRQEIPLYLEPRPEAPGRLFLQQDTIANAFYPLFGVELMGAGENRKKFVVKSVVPGSIGDELGFSEMDPIELLKAKYMPEQEVIYVEVYTKKRKGGYLDVTLALFAALDSPYFF